MIDGGWYINARSIAVRQFARVGGVWGCVWGWLVQQSAECIALGLATSLASELGVGSGRDSRLPGHTWQGVCVAADGSRWIHAWLCSVLQPRNVGLDHGGDWHGHAVFFRLLACASILCRRIVLGLFDSPADYHGVAGIGGQVAMALGDKISADLGRWLRADVYEPPFIGAQNRDRLGSEWSPL